MLSNEFLLLWQKESIESTPLPHEGLGECVSFPSAFVPSGSDKGHMDGLALGHAHCLAPVLLFQESCSYVTNVFSSV